MLWLFVSKNRNAKSVFGLRRRERIACPTFQKTTLFGVFTFFCVVPRSRFFYTFCGAAAAKASKITPKRVGIRDPVVGGKVTVTIATLPPDKVFRLCAIFFRNCAQNEENHAKSSQTAVLWEVPCAIRTRRRSPNTLFACLPFWEKNTSKPPQKGGDPPQTPPENHMFCIFLQKVQKVSKNTFRKK